MEASRVTPLWAADGNAVAVRSRYATCGRRKLKGGLGDNPRPAQMIVSESASEPVEAGCCVLRPSEEAPHPDGFQGDQPRVTNAPSLGVASWGRGRYNTRLGGDAAVTACRAGIRERQQHKWRKRHRCLQPARRRDADTDPRLAVCGRRSRKPGEDALTRGAATEHRRPLPVGSRSRQQRDLGAAIEPDGSLELVGDGPVCSNGVNPVSIAIHGQLVYVDNAGTPTSSGQTNQPWDFDETQPDQYPLLLQFPSFELYRKQVVKQADLVLCTGAAMRSARRRRPATSPTTRPLRSETPRFRRVRRR
jgi:hypothetical protein